VFILLQAAMLSKYVEEDTKPREGEREKGEG
jgi:hypothetical protein